MLLVALIFAATASFMSYSWLQKRAGGPVAEAKPTKKVVAAGVQIPYGTTITLAQLKTVAWPADLLPEGSISNIKDVVGKVATRIIYPDDLITTKRVAQHVDGNQLAALIPKDMRAITIRVDDVVGVAGFLLPGNHVDVIGVRTLLRSRRVVTKTVMRDVIVLAVDQDISPDKSKPKVVRAVTLEMKPESTLKVMKAAAEGKIQLVLRNPEDRYVPPKRGHYVARHVQKHIVRKPQKVTVIRGTDVADITPKKSEGKVM